MSCFVSVQPLVCSLARVSVCAFLLTGVAAAQGVNSPDFARDIRPILSSNCFTCHGPDEQTREADLRLDVFENATADRDGIRAIFPRQPQRSEIMKRIRAEDPDLVMPPSESGRSLTEAEISLLERWIESGAKMDRHWAFDPPVRPPIPAPAIEGWSDHVIDRFTARKMVEHGLSPSRQADPVVLLRRVYLDLIGLPPTPQEISDYLDDPSEDRLGRVVDRLLASEHYGERWGRVWLDAARYADSDGFEKDKPRQVWFYRDWVVRAFNNDMPYDQFIIEQIAGDLIPKATQDQFVATGFLRNSMTNEEGGIDPEQFRMEAMFDRMDAIGKSVLGFTIQCAQCHSHKFDPLTQDEYYGMFAFLNNAHEANIEVFTNQQQEQAAVIREQIRQLHDAMRMENPTWKEKQFDWKQSILATKIGWTILDPKVDDISSGGQKYLPQTDGSLLAQGYAPTKHRVKLTCDIPGGSITAFQLELMRDQNLPRGGPGRSTLGTGALSEFQVEIAPQNDPSQVTKVTFVRALADLEAKPSPLPAMYHDRSKTKRTVGPASFAIDGDETTAWSHDAGPIRRNQDCRIIFLPESPVEVTEPSTITFYLSQKHGGWNSDDNQTHNLGRFRLSYSSETATQSLTEHSVCVSRQVLKVLNIPVSRRTAEQRVLVFDSFRKSVPEWEEFNQQIEMLWNEYPEGTTQLAALERDENRQTHVLNRGDFLKPIRPITPQTPSFLHAYPEDSPRNRLGFAKWLVDRRSPSTARSIVNRVWQQYFGTGLVETSEDLGVQSSPPTHPQLLDWLAVEFMESGWRFKHLHRLIIRSATYRQSSHVTEEQLEKDPLNRWLARGARYRVDAEIVRDICLSSSGLLDRSVGGPSEYPPAPDFLFQPPVSYGPKIWKSNIESNRFRRSLYTFRYRSVPYPALQTFDAPNGDFSCVRRARSNTPLQALTTWNEPVFVRCAQELARRVLASEGATDRERIEQAFQYVLTRRPANDEITVLTELLTQERQHYAADKVAAQDLAGHATGSGIPGAPETRDIDIAEQAAWTAIARVLLNLDETITRQ